MIAKFLKIKLNKIEEKVNLLEKKFKKQIKKPKKNK